MTSERRQRANRANARSSTGPKTAGGKARSAQNAFRHGLNVPVLSDPSLAPEVEAIARRICAPYENGETLEWARRIAEAQVEAVTVPVRCLSTPMRLWTCSPRSPLKVRKSLRLSSRTKFQSLRYSTGTSDALYRDGKPRSAILTRLERSSSRTAHTEA